jgi:hypothetical protein
MRFEQRLLPHILAVIGAHVLEAHSGCSLAAIEHAADVLDDIGENLRAIATKLDDMDIL